MLFYELNAIWMCHLGFSEVLENLVFPSYNQMKIIFNNFQISHTLIDLTHKGLNKMEIDPEIPIDNKPSLFQKLFFGGNRQNHYLNQWWLGGAYCILRYESVNFVIVDSSNLLEPGRCHDIAGTHDELLSFGSIGKYVGEITIKVPWWRHQMEHFPRYWRFVRGIHQSPVNSPHKCQ